MWFRGNEPGIYGRGLDLVAAYDHWDVAVDTYRRNLGNHAHRLDLADVDRAVAHIGEFEPDVIAGGPPCQDFSTAGKRVEGARANLTEAFGQIVVRCRPRMFVMENVPQARLSLVYQSMKANLEKAGYTMEARVLDASLCGVPQRRKRFFVFGSTEAGAPARFLESIERRLAPDSLTVKRYLKNEIDIEFYYRHPRSYTRRSVFSVHEPSPTIRGVNRPVPPKYIGNHLDSAPPATVRALTTLERSRIQTFPKDWNWNSTNRNSDTEVQIGNAVPVNLAAFVASAVLDAA